MQKNFPDGLSELLKTVENPLNAARFIYLDFAYQQRGNEYNFLKTSSYRPTEMQATQSKKATLILISIKSS